MKPQIKYDKKSNILNIRFSKKKSVDSEVKDNVVIDYDENGEIVNLEIMKIDLREFAESAKANQSVLEFAAWFCNKVMFELYLNHKSYLNSF